MNVGYGGGLISEAGVCIHRSPARGWAWRWMVSCRGDHRKEIHGWVTFASADLVVDRGFVRADARGGRVQERWRRGFNSVGQREEERQDEHQQSGLRQDQGW